MEYFKVGIEVRQDGIICPHQWLAPIPSSPGQSLLGPRLGGTGGNFVVVLVPLHALAIEPVRRLSGPCRAAKLGLQQLLRSL